MISRSRSGDRELGDDEYRTLIGAMVAELGNKGGFVIKASQERGGRTVTVTVTDP